MSLVSCLPNYDAGWDCPDGEHLVSTGTSGWLRDDSLAGCFVAVLKGIPVGAGGSAAHPSVTGGTRGPCTISRHEFNAKVR
jgi:hypothetical protein